MSKPALLKKGLRLFLQYRFSYFKNYLSKPALLKKGLRRMPPHSTTHPIQVETCPT